MDTNAPWHPTPPTEDSAREKLAEGVLGRRVAAFLVDGLLCSAIIAVTWLVLLMFGLLTFGLGLPLLGVLPAVPFLYNWLSVASPMSATPGQSAMGLIVRREADLAAPTPLEALIWTGGFVLTISLGAIWFAAALVTVRHRTLHDIASGLSVVRRRGLARLSAKVLSSRLGSFQSLTATPVPLNAGGDRPEYV